MTKTWVRTLAICLAFALALAGTFVFAYRAGREARHIHAANEPIRPWMSIPFIAHAHHVPRGRTVPGNRRRAPPTPRPPLPPTPGA